MKRATEIYLYFLIGFYPLVFSPSGLSNIFATKRFFFFAATVVYLLTLGVLAVIQRRKIRLNLACIFALAFLFITALSAALSEHFPKTLFGVSRYEGLFTILLYVALFISFSLFGSVSSGHVYTLIGSNTLFGAVCVLQLQGFNPLGLYPEGYTFFDGGVRYSGSYIGTIGNADLVGAYFCIIIPILFYILFKSRLKLRILALIPLALLLYTVLKMSVMAAIVGLLAGAVFALPDFFNFSRRAILIYSFSILSLAVIAIVILKKAEIGSGFLYEIHEILNGRIKPEFGSNRIRIWRDVLSVLREAPILGKGPDTMLLENFEKFSTFYPALNKTLTATIDVAHNEYLNVLYHQGILGLVSYLAIIVAVLKKALTSEGALSSALTVGAVSYLVQAFFGFSMCIVSPFFWITLALLNQKKPPKGGFFFIR